MKFGHPFRWFWRVSTGAVLVALNPGTLAQQPSLEDLLRDLTAPALEAVPETPESGPAAQPPTGEIPEAAQATDSEAPSTPAPGVGPVVEGRADSALPQGPQELAEQERVRLQAREVEGLKDLAAAYDAMRRGDYPQAITLFGQALEKIPVRPATDEIRRRAVFNRGEAAYRAAVAHYRQSEFAQARQMANQAIEFDEAGHGTRARSLLARIDAAEARQQRREEQEAARPKLPPEVVEKEAAVEQLFQRGKFLFDEGEYDRAEAVFEQILLRDPYHRDAMRFLKRIEERRLAASNVRRQTTITDMVQDVRERWNPPIRRPMVEAPELDRERERQIQTASQRLRERMQNIIIPSISFRRASIVDVINFLREASEAHDPERIGVNIILKLDTGAQAPTAPAPAPAPAFEDPWATTPVPPAPAQVPETELAQPGLADIPTISLTLRRISLLEAIRYVTEVAGLKYRIEENVVVITPREVVTNVITRMYPVMPSIIQIAVERREQEQTRGDQGFTALGGGATIRTSPDEDIKGMFERMGVPFPPGTSLSYNSTISQLIVTNTPENLEILERILNSLDIVPKQVEIEARFVEINQIDLEELGFEWMLTDHWQLANKRGPGPIASRERIQMNANAAQGGFTRGLRYFSGAPDGANPATSTLASSAGLTGTLFSISSILTNPELTFVLHALSMKGGTDLLSAPRVTTRSGVNAQIQVVEEIIYPTEWEEQTVESMVDVAYRTPLPRAFETREVGVILNVTPTVSPDGYTIDLTLVPEVAELAGWLDYGPPGRYPILQPVFASRNVTSSIVLWDNQTIVMGGLIRDQATRFTDKVPLLGDLPLIGRLFRSEGERSVKRNLIIFVTARLVNPAGYPVHEPKDAVGERW